MSFSKIRNNVLWCILLLWTFSMAGNVISSDLKGDEEAAQDEQTSKTFRDGNIVQPGDVQLNTDGSEAGILSPVDVQSTDRTFRDGDVIKSGDVQINTDGSETGNFLRPVDVQSTDRKS